jgi:hypothetical protein
METLTQRYLAAYGKENVPLIQKMLKQAYIFADVSDLLQDISEYYAIKLLKLVITRLEYSGTDVIRKTKQGDQKLLIKGTVIGNIAGLGSFQINKGWHSIILVMFDEEFNPIKIFEAEKSSVRKLLKEFPPKWKFDRVKIPLDNFISISKLIWEKKSK